MFTKLLCRDTCNRFPATPGANNTVLSFLAFQLLWEKKAISEVHSHLPGWGLKGQSCWAMLIFKSNAWHKQETRDTTARLGISEKPDVSQACSTQTKSTSKRMIWEKDKQFYQLGEKGKTSGEGLFPGINQFNFMSTLTLAEGKATFRIWHFFSRSNQVLMLLTGGNCPYEKPCCVYSIIRLQTTATSHNAAPTVSVLAAEDYDVF